ARLALRRTGTRPRRLRGHHLRGAPVGRLVRPQSLGVSRKLPETAAALWRCHNKGGFARGAAGSKICRTRKECVMSATGLEVLDKSLQTTNIWLKEIMEAVGPDRHVAWRVLGAVLHALRDRLAVEQVAHLGAELPIVIRGLYYDQWHPAGKPEKERRADEFVARVND